MAALSLAMPSDEKASIVVMWVMQAHHIDTDSYDRFFGPSA